MRAAKGGGRAADGGVVIVDGEHVRGQLFKPTTDDSLATADEGAAASATTTADEALSPFEPCAGARADAALSSRAGRGAFVLFRALFR